jgi:hypothetical protein
MITRLMTVKALVCSAAVVLLCQTAAYAGHQSPRLSSAQAQRLSRDLIHNDSQDFFKQGQDLIEREIQILRKRELSSNDPILKIKLCRQEQKTGNPASCSTDSNNNR